MTDSSLSTELLGRVIRQLGLDRIPPATPDGLHAVYARWCQRVPFDNIRKLIHIHRRNPLPLPGDDPVDFFESWLRDGAGGMCWAGNGALFSLLAALGFAVERGLATMRPSPEAPANHGTVTVRFGETRYLVDASILHGEPLRLDDSKSTRVSHRAWGVVCGKVDGVWSIRWRALHGLDGFDCRLDRLSATAEDFRRLHESTRMSSPFNDEVYVRLNRADAVVGMMGNERIDIGPGGEVARTALRRNDQTRFLVEELGIDRSLVGRLPPDAPSRSLPGSVSHH